MIWIIERDVCTHNNIQPKQCWGCIHFVYCPFLSHCQQNVLIVNLIFILFCTFFETMNTQWNHSSTSYPCNAQYLVSCDVRKENIWGMHIPVKMGKSGQHPNDLLFRKYFLIFSSKLLLKLWECANSIEMSK